MVPQWQLCHFTAGVLTYRYNPQTQQMWSMTERIIDLYSRHLVPVTRLTRSRSSSRVHKIRRRVQDQKELGCYERQCDPESRSATDFGFIPQSSVVLFDDPRCNG